MSVRERIWTDEDGHVHQAWVIDVKMKMPGRGVVRVRETSPINTKRGAQHYEQRVRAAVLDGTQHQQRRGQPQPARTPRRRSLPRAAQPHWALLQ